jgi:hypothetical protein
MQKFYGWWDAMFLFACKMSIIYKRHAVRVLADHATKYFLIIDYSKYPCRSIDGYAIFYPSFA